MGDYDDSSSECSSYPPSPLASEPYGRVPPTSKLRRSSCALPSTATTSLSSLSSFYQSSNSFSSSASSSSSLTLAIPIKRGGVGRKDREDASADDYGFFADFEEPITEEVLIRNTPPKGVYSIGEDLTEE
ncbi:hypothetical protein TrRE_jg12754 [Triparma retinervis]|uniref:Uncharacterized protein n=1 Tax=Triparma retinervis TaxID=2557542 RepID=A0A9W7A921_9STRA|nr:hypothetical protein TrRE_jg12754 [Triparma retinervis]